MSFPLPLQINCKLLEIYSSLVKVCKYSNLPNYKNINNNNNNNNNNSNHSLRWDYPGSVASHLHRRIQGKISNMQPKLKICKSYRKWENVRSISNKQLFKSAEKNYAVAWNNQALVARYVEEQKKNKKKRATKTKSRSSKKSGGQKSKICLVKNMCRSKILTPSNVKANRIQQFTRDSQHLYDTSNKPLKRSNISLQHIKLPGPDFFHDFRNVQSEQQKIRRANVYHDINQHFAKHSSSRILQNPDNDQSFVDKHLPLIENEKKENSVASHKHIVVKHPNFSYKNKSKEPNENKMNEAMKLVLKKFNVNHTNYLSKPNVEGSKTNRQISKKKINSNLPTITEKSKNFKLRHTGYNTIRKNNNSGNDTNTKYIETETAEKNNAINDISTNSILYKKLVAKKSPHVPLNNLNIFSRFRIKIEKKSPPLSTEILKKFKQVSKEYDTPSSEKLNLYDESSDRSKIYGESPERSKIYDESPERSKIYDESPERSKIYDESPERSRIYDKSPDRSKIYDESPDRSKLYHESSDPISKSYEESSDQISKLYQTKPYIPPEAYKFKYNDCREPHFESLKRSPEKPMHNSSSQTNIPKSSQTNIPSNMIIVNEPTSPRQGEYRKKFTYAEKYAMMRQLQVNSNNRARLNQNIVKSEDIALKEQLIENQRNVLLNDDKTNIASKNLNRRTEYSPRPVIKTIIIPSINKM